MIHLVINIGAQYKLIAAACLDSQIMDLPVDLRQGLPRLRKSFLIAVNHVILLHLSAWRVARAPKLRPYADLVSVPRCE